MKVRRDGARRIWLALLAFLWLAGCNLCTRHLGLYRDTETRSLPASGMALLITDPQLAAAVSPEAGRFTGGGCPWMEERSVHDTEAYRLSLDQVDGKPVYQGMCLDITPTYSLEVRPGARQLLARLDIYGPGGHEKLREVMKVDLAAGGTYLVQADCQAMKDRRLVLKIQRLPEPYSDRLRSRVVEWNRQHDKTRKLAD